MIANVETTTHLAIELDTRLNLGNNFSYQQFIDALAEDPQDTVEVYELFQLDDDITIVATGNYGEVCINTCGSDLHDHLKAYYDDISWCADTSAYYYRTMRGAEA